MNTSPPHSIEIEQAVLGGVIQDAPSCWPALATEAPELFWREGHRVIFRAMQAIIARHGPQGMDVVALVTHLTTTGDIGRAGGMSYVSSLVTHCPSPVTVPAHVARLGQMAAARDARSAGAELAQAGQMGRELTEDLEAARARLDSLVARLAPRRAGTLKESLQALMGKVQRGMDGDLGLKTGIAPIDALIDYLDDTDLMILAGRPSMGKTALALQIALAVATRGEGVLVASLEMSREQLAARAASAHSGLDARALRSPGRMASTDWARLLRAVQELAPLPMQIDDDAGCSPAHLTARARAFEAEMGTPLKLVVVDYLQLMPTTRSDSRNREQEVAHISSELKRLAKSLRVPVLALAQLSRGMEKRDDKRPLMGDLRESGQIEQDADVVLMIYRDDYYHEDSPEPGVAEVWIRKNRNGGLGCAKLRFDAERTRFLPLETHRTPPPHLRPVETRQHWTEEE